MDEACETVMSAPLPLAKTSHHAPGLDMLIGQWVGVLLHLQGGERKRKHETVIKSAGENGDG